MFQPLLRALLAFEAASPKEASDRDFIISFIAEREWPFDRANLDAHLTGSALIIDAQSRHILLGFHRKLNRWLQLGGHGEPRETSAEAVAVREAQEESGLTSFEFCNVATRPFDIDIHMIPERAGVPEHLHLDLRYLLTTPKIQPVYREDEHLEMRWFSFDEVLALNLDESLRRAIGKILK